MNFIADENVDSEIVERLRKDGHQVWYVAELEPGIPDDAVLELANKGKALLLTADKDFGELIYRQNRISQGVMLIRLAGLSAENKATTISLAVNKHSSELSHAFTVVSSRAIRIRHKHK